MREAFNIQLLTELNPEYMGLIFYPKSKRYVASNEGLSKQAGIERVGVFVNTTIEDIEEKAIDFDLDLIQLHGDENVDFARALSEKGFRIMKVFCVLDILPIEEMREYEPFVEFFLFDTKSGDYGGSGRKFDWDILKTYSLNKPFFLSGGIDLEDIETIKSMDLKMLYAIDVNSRFELAPGVKDIEKIKELKELI